MVPSAGTFKCNDRAKTDQSLCYGSFVEILISFVNWYSLCNNFQIKSLFKYPKKIEITLCQTIIPSNTLYCYKALYIWLIETNFVIKR